MIGPRFIHPILTALLALGLSAALALPGLAMQPPAPGMVERMRAEGSFDEALAFANKLGNHQLRPAKRGAFDINIDPQDFAAQIFSHLGESLDAKGAKSISAASARELAWTELDLNHDRVVDERDVLALGLPRPKGTAEFPSLGTNKTFALLIDFDDYPSYFPKEEFEKNLFDVDGEPAYYYKGLRPYYEMASYGQVHMEGSVYGWHRASHPRTWYHPDDSADYGYSWGRQAELVEEAIMAADASGEDFSQYDNDGDGAVDYFLVIWSGPNGDWASFWWGYFGVSLPGSFVVDGVRFSSYSWQWERYHYFGQDPPELEHWDPIVTIHETGHALGIPDYYDYDGSVGPDGGCGGLDIMDATWGDHCCFSKYWLGWLSPTIAFTNLNDEQLDESSANPDCVLFMPGYDPVAPWAEYFMAQNRNRTGLDAPYPSDGLILWHVDSRVNEGGGMRYNNSYTDHKLLKLMQADGLEEIENGVQGADAEDYYNSGEALSAASNPNSNRYDGSVTNAACNDISANGSVMTADFTLYGSNPPSVNITNPLPGDTVSGLLNIGAGATDDGGISKMQVLVDGELIYTTGTASVSVPWNTLVEFNKTLDITVRAWDDGNQMGSATISVTVNNAGIPSVNDDFESGLLKWRAQNDPFVTIGQYTDWDLRISPGDGAPLGSLNELWIRPISTEDCRCYEFLRSQRFDTAGYVRPLQLRFQYRTRDGFAIEMTEDQGASWTTLANLGSTWQWQTYNSILDLQDKVFYLRIRYTGSVRDSYNAGWGVNIDNFILRESPSDPPTLSFTSPLNGDTVSGSTVFTTNAADDNGVARVMFFVNDSAVTTDGDGAPWQYSRDTLWEDNIPDLRVRAIAEDGDGLFSAPAEITVAIRNPRSFPVHDDIEAGTDFWAFQNDGLLPNWAASLTLPHSGVNCIGFEPGANPWQSDNYDGIWFSGPPLTDIRTAIDLSGPDCLRPELNFWYNADQPGNGYLALYFYNTWYGWQQFAAFDNNNDSVGWVKKTYDLSRFRGQSGQIVWWYFGGDQTNGTGIWLDDISVDNKGPQLDALKPASALVGQTISLLGTGFGNTQGTSVVHFTGADPAPADYLSWSDGQIDLLVPDGATDGDVTVSVSTGDTAGVLFKLGSLSLALAGVDPQQIYLPPTGPTLNVLYQEALDNVQLIVDGQQVDESTAAPYSDLSIPLESLSNGQHSVWLTGSRLGASASSAPRSFSVFTLRGDVNGDGVVSELDVPALIPYIGMDQFSPGFMPWYDPDQDGAVTEADVSYIGYHSGDTL